MIVVREGQRTEAARPAPFVVLERVVAGITVSAVEVSRAEAVRLADDLCVLVEAWR